MTQFKHNLRAAANRFKSQIGDRSGELTFEDLIQGDMYVECTAEVDHSGTYDRDPQNNTNETHIKVTRFVVTDESCEEIPNVPGWVRSFFIDRVEEG